MGTSFFGSAHTQGAFEIVEPEFVALESASLVEVKAPSIPPRMPVDIV